MNCGSALLTSAVPVEMRQLVRHDWVLAGSCMHTQRRLRRYELDAASMRRTWYACLQCENVSLPDEWSRRIDY